jgi:hypothetical protein
MASSNSAMANSISREFIGIAAMPSTEAIGDTVTLTVVVEQMGTGDASHTR